MQGYVNIRSKNLQHSNTHGQGITYIVRWNNISINMNSSKFTDGWSLDACRVPYSIMYRRETLTHCLWRACSGQVSSCSVTANANMWARHIPSGQKTPCCRLLLKSHEPSFPCTSTDNLSESALSTSILHYCVVKWLERCDIFLTNYNTL